MENKNAAAFRLTSGRLRIDLNFQLLNFGSVLHFFEINLVLSIGSLHNVASEFKIIEV